LQQAHPAAQQSPLTPLKQHGPGGLQQSAPGTQQSAFVMVARGSGAAFDGDTAQAVPAIRARARSRPRNELLRMVTFSSVNGWFAFDRVCDL
jgi:hypothetical protein